MRLTEGASPDRRANVVGLSLGALICVLGLTPAAWAQQAGGIAGVVKDTSGGALPGVTVEAASPALIEKTRTVVTDGEGRYNIVDLRLGAYTVTFTLLGFSTLKREGIELKAGFTATVNADLQVGSLEETITVTGAAPLVDTQNVRQQTVVSSELLAVLPTGSKGLLNFTGLTPGLSAPADVGGSAGGHRSMAAQVTKYHGRAQGKINVDGMGVLNPVGDGNASYVVNAAIVEEMVMEAGAISAESSASGFAFNAIPKEGGNTFKFNSAARYTNSSMQSNNLDDSLRGRGLTTVDSILRIYDVSVGVGGPIKRDKLWFYGSGRLWGDTAIVGGIFWNNTQGTPFYTPDFNRPSDRREYYRSIASRFTWQASTKNKVSGFSDFQNNVVRRNFGSDAPEAKAAWHFATRAKASLRHPGDGLHQIAWTRTATNRLLFEAGAGMMHGGFPGIMAQPGVDPYHDISILEQSTNFRYNAATSYSLYEDRKADRQTWRAAMSYITGSHSVKVGIQNDRLLSWQKSISNPLYVSYTFNKGVPVRVTQQSGNGQLRKDEVKFDMGIYAQDQWTLKRMSLNYGLRFDYFNGHIPEQVLTDTLYVPATTFAARSGVPSWKDLNPRVGVSYDLFGTGKTALKASVGRYVDKAATAIPGALNPISTSVNSVNRTWNDTNKNYYPDCDLRTFAANGECGAISDLNFGNNNPNATSWADDVLHGFGARNANWNITTEVQHELRPGMSLSAGYYRNDTGRYRVTQNEAVTPADYDQFCITAPVDARLPGGGGYQVCGLYDVTLAKFGQVTNVVKRDTVFGKQTRSSDFFGVSFDTRLGKGVLFGGGLDTGRIVSDSCFVVDSPQALLNCRIIEPWRSQTQVKLHWSVPLPSDISLSGIFQNVAGPEYEADYTATNAEIRPSLGRNLAACGARADCTSTVTVPLVTPQTLFEPRRTQVDLRLSKLISVGKTRLRLNLDAYNALNANSILQERNAYGPLWRIPASVNLTSGAGTLDGRMIAFSGDLSF